MAIIPTPPYRPRRQHSQPEARIQAECVMWLWNDHPETRRLFFHVPNEGNRDSRIDGAMRKSMGLIAGVADTILFMPRGPYHALCVEFKTPEGTQSDKQVEWQGLVEKQGYCYRVCRSLEEFKEIIKWYLGLNT